MAESLDGLPEPNTDGTLLRLVGLVDSCDLFCDVEVGGRQLTDPAKVVHSFLAAVMEEQPTRRFPDPQRTNE